jgi:hypothetical protein
LSGLSAIGPPLKICEAKRNRAESIVNKTVLDVSKIAMAYSAHNRRQTTLVARDSGIQAAIRQFFHPYVLAFLALALVVGAYGYGYKLSQYSHHSGVSKASPTHVWVDHRDETVGVQALHHAAPQDLSDFAVFAAFVPPVPRLSRDHVVITPAPARVAVFISSNIPFRAPPSLHSSQA